MLSSEINLDSTPDKRAYAVPELDRLVLIPIIVGLLAAASILSGTPTATCTSAQATIEEDPNLKAQYTEEQDVLRRHAQDLKEKSSGAGHAVMTSVYAALLLLLGAGVGVFALVTKSVHSGYASLLLGVIGVALGLRALF